MFSDDAKNSGEKDASVPEPLGWDAWQVPNGGDTPKRRRRKKKVASVEDANDKEWQIIKLEIIDFLINQLVLHLKLTSKYSGGLGAENLSMQDTVNKIKPDISKDNVADEGVISVAKDAATAVEAVVVETAAVETAAVETAANSKVVEKLEIEKVETVVSPESEIVESKESAQPVTAAAQPVIATADVKDVEIAEKSAAADEAMTSVSGDNGTTTQEVISTAPAVASDADAHIMNINKKYLTYISQMNMVVVAPSDRVSP